ncbi:MAG TPA: hypothetical protein VFX28_07290, partial [Methylomirabilota bacterium]|nr:hypothetical protein [Methylomirabilota bacterium]
MLVRVFAIEQFHHFAYMAVGVAMLGYGASGTLVAGLGDRAQRFGERWWPRAVALTSVALIAAPALVHLIDLDATRLIWEWRPWVAVAAVYAVLAVPFALGALAILLALTAERERPGVLYGASFVGAAAGALGALLALRLALPPRALAVPALIAAAAALLAARGAWRWLPAAAAVAAMAWPPWRLALTPYKGLAQVEAYPDARRVAERASPVGWTVAVRAAAFRHAPGLSLGYRGAFPPQTALFLDGDLAGAAADWSAVPEAGELFEWLPSAAAYALGQPAHVLVVGGADGIETWSALAHGAGRVTAVELSHDLGTLVRRHSSPSLAADPRVAWVTGDARGAIARSDERFDLVVLGPGGGFGATAAGVHALNEDFLHTVEAYETYLERLQPGGVLAVTRWVTVPPRASVRVILTAAAALRRRGAGTVAGGIVVTRGWGTATVLVKPSGFQPEDLARLRRWAAERDFDLD